LVVINTQMMTTKSYLNSLAYKILGAAIEVHRELGPGLLESIYHHCLRREFDLNNINYCSQLRIPIEYKGWQIDADYRLDYLIENEIILEIKSVERLLPIHEAQLLTYLKLLQKSKGILINFNSRNLVHEGSKQMVSACFRTLPD